MASSFTSSLRLTKQGTGDNPTTWGTVLNDQMIALIDTAVAGITSIDATGSGDITLTSNNGSTDQARSAILAFTGTPGANRNVIVPSVSKTYVVFNNTTAQSLVFQATGSSETVTIPFGERAFVFCDGTDLFELVNTGNLIPSGLISMWSGTIANIPAGWVLCDGTNSTPDLRDKFVVAARQDDGGVPKTNLTGSLTSTGGSTTTSDAGSHNHGGSTAAHILVISEMPAHTHGYTWRGALVNGDAGSFLNIGPLWQNDNASGVTQSTGGNGGHDHDISDVADHNHTATPPYYALAFMMKV